MACNVTVTSSASAAVYSFTAKSTSGISGIGYTTSTVLTFKYTPVNITTFANLTSNSTYMWSTTTTSRNGTTFYYYMESYTTSGNSKNLRIRYNSSKTTNKAAIIGELKYDNKLVKQTDSIVANRQYSIFG